MERIVFLERKTIAAEFRRPDFDHQWIEFGESFQNQVVERLRGATIAISNTFVALMDLITLSPILVFSFCIILIGCLSCFNMVYSVLKLFICQ